MKKILAFSLLASTVITSCKDKNDPNPPANTSYQPTTTGSTWTYQFKNNVNTTTTSYTLTATGSDTVILGKSYKKFTRSDNGSSEYYYKDGNNYYQFGGIAGITESTELLYFKADAAAGASWEETKNVVVPGLGTANVKLTNNVVEKPISFTVNGKVYNNVTHIKTTLSNITVSGVPIAITSQDLHFYYAEGIGRIKSQVKLVIALAGVNADNETNLTASVIKP